LRHPLVQAALMVNEKEVTTKLLPSNAYASLEESVKDLAGPSGCRHIIINIGLVNDKWDVVEALVCEGELVASNVDLKSYAPEAEVERVVGECYEFPKELIEKLEELSKVEVKEEVERYEAVKVVRAPPLPRARAEEIAAREPKLPTDLLNNLTDEWATYKSISHALIIFLETSEVDSYAVATGSTEDGKIISLVYLPAEYKPKMEELEKEIIRVASENDVDIVYLNVGGAEKLISTRG